MSERVCHRVPVLTYHSMNVDGRDYANNDHVALAADLEWLHARAWQIVPLRAVVRGDHMSNLRNSKPRALYSVQRAREPVRSAGSAATTSLTACEVPVALVRWRR